MSEEQRERLNKLAADEALAAQITAQLAPDSQSSQVGESEGTPALPSFSEDQVRKIVAEALQQQADARKPWTPGQHNTYFDLGAQAVTALYMNSQGRGSTPQLLP